MVCIVLIWKRDDITSLLNVFCRTVNDTTYFGIAKEKAEALREFEVRQQGGENVGLVESR